MAGKVVSDWTKIGQSGPTMDGRTIEKQWLIDAAETYDKEIYQAVVWPEHNRYYNLGLVDDFKIENRDDGIIEAFAKVSPNSWFLSENSAGQSLFGSMELLPNFAGTGKWYLSGLGATDEPASLGTKPFQFSANANNGAVRGDFIALDLTTEKPQSSFFKKWFSGNKNEGNAMADKAELLRLQKRIDELETKFSAGGSDPKPESKPESLTLEGLGEKLNAFMDETKKAMESFSQPKTNDSALADDLKKLREEFNAALKEATPGTKTPEGESNINPNHYL